MGRSLGVLHATGQDGDPPAPAEVIHLVFPGATVGETAESLERLRAALALATGTSGGPAFTASFGSPTPPPAPPSTRSSRLPTVRSSEPRSSAATGS
jgi:hypothetical protein